MATTERTTEGNTDVNNSSGLSPFGESRRNFLKLFSGSLAFGLLTACGVNTGGRPAENPSPSSTPSPKPTESPTATPTETSVPPTATAEATATTTPPPDPTKAPDPTRESTQVPEAVIDPAKCVFIKDPEICILGQPKTRVGYDDQILGISYENIPGTQIYTREGYFSVATDMKTKKIVSVQIRFKNGNIANIHGDDLVIENPRSRDVSEGEPVVKVGESGQVLFSVGAKRDPNTGQYIIPPNFFEENFPDAVLKKTKIVLPAVSGTPSSILLTTRYQ